MAAPTIRSKSVRVARFGMGMAHTKQKHAASPTNRGTWVWVDGFREPGMTFLRRQPYYPKISYDFDIYADREQLEANWKREEEWLRVNPGKWRYGWVDLDSKVYVGWLPDGTITRSGFFNSGDWNHLTMSEAIKGLRKIVARAKAQAATTGEGMYDPWPKFSSYIDFADLQVYVPKTTKIKSKR